MLNTLFNQITLFYPFFLSSFHFSLKIFFKNYLAINAIDILLLEESLAVVRVLEEQLGNRIDFTDVLLLLKMDGQWKCVAKAYNQNSDTIQNN